jgi:ABC-type hemin transport system ATPase subunit
LEVDQELQAVPEGELHLELLISLSLALVAQRTDLLTPLASHPQYFESHLSDAPTRSFDLMHQVSRLRQGRKMSDNEVKVILGTLAEHSKTDEQIVAVSSQ